MDTQKPCVNLNFFLFGYCGTVYALFLYTSYKRRQRLDLHYKKYIKELERLGKEEP